MESNILNLVLRSAKQHLKNLVQFKNVYVVLGNETCDLDSAVSCLVYSLLLHSKASCVSIVIPVFNIPGEQLPIKTEVTYLLKKYGINLDDIVCRDKIDLESLQSEGSLRLILVDHHVLFKDNQLSPSVVEVIDHRPPDPAWPWPNVDITLNIVGSCSTLVAEKLLTQAPDLVTPTIATCLLGTILLDTACLSPAVGRATPLDFKIAAQLKTLCSQTLDQEQLYKELQTAKSDISTLTAAQLLIKDLKLASGIPIVGLPLKVKEFLQRDDAIVAVHQFCDDHKVEVCVIYGLGVEQGSLTRDIAVFGLANCAAASQVVTALLSCKEPCLHLQSLPCSVQGFTLFEQLNIKASRKQVLPIVQQVAEMFKKNKKETSK